MTRWYVSRVEILNSPSIRLHGLDHETELSKRQTCASLIQEMATRLKVQQLVTNTAIIYMHRFYLIHSFHNFEAHWVAPACLFLAAKVEEQPRRLEHVIREAHMLLAPTQPLDARGTHSREYHEMAEYLVSLENILLQTLGFDIRIDQPHIHIVRHCNSTKTPKEITQLAYFLATNALHLTTFAVQYPPTRIAAVCLMLAGKWMNYEARSPAVCVSPSAVSVSGALTSAL
jgi:cyclin T